MGAGVNRNVSRTAGEGAATVMGTCTFFLFRRDLEPRAPRTASDPSQALSLDHARTASSRRGARRTGLSGGPRRVQGLIAGLRDHVAFVHAARNDELGACFLLATPGLVALREILDFVRREEQAAPDRVLPGEVAARRP